jgi:phage replication O-like protein O
MANPQIENGFIKIANEIYEALCRIRISGEARQVLDFILRKTYGFNKKQDKISLSQFVLGTGLKKSTICRATNKLKEMKLIIKIDNEDCTIYRFNKDFEEWEGLSKKRRGVSKKIISVDKIDNASLSKLRHTKDNTTKYTLTKDITSEQSSQVQKIMEVFYKINPTLNWGNKTDRGACLDLIKQFGFPNTKVMAEKAVAVQGRAYAPRITKPYQLKSKLADLKIYFDSENAKKPKIVKIRE